MGGYEQGLQAAVDLSIRLAALLAAPGCPVEARPVELAVAGRVSEKRPTPVADAPRASQGRAAGQLELGWIGAARPDPAARSLGSSALFFRYPSRLPQFGDRSAGLRAAGDRLRYRRAARAGVWEIPGWSSRMAAIPGSWNPRMSPPWRRLPWQSWRTSHDFGAGRACKPKTAFGLDQMVEKYLEVLLKGQS